jgi:hypothetical protein
MEDFVGAKARFTRYSSRKERKGAKDAKYEYI